VLPTSAAKQFFSQEAFAEIDKGALVKADPSSSESFYFDGLGTPYNKIDRSSFTCLCKVNHVKSIAENQWGALPNEGGYYLHT